MNVSSLKLKTTSSYYIREIIFYYRNYNRVYKQMCADADLRSSVISLTREELVNSEMGEIE